MKIKIEKEHYFREQSKLVNPIVPFAYIEINGPFSKAEAPYVKTEPVEIDNHSMTNAICMKGGRRTRFYDEEMVTDLSRTINKRNW